MVDTVLFHSNKERVGSLYFARFSMLNPSIPEQFSVFSQEQKHGMAIEQYRLLQ